jgi:predicted branched-subunit amino acid permease
METNRNTFKEGMRDGIPIGIGYFAVAFSLGITARDCGFTAFQGFLSSITTYASAGQYIGYTLYAANATLVQLFIMTIITNARYLLMGVALNQKLPSGTPLRRRMLCGVAITDEIFGITIARPGYLNPFYPLGALTTAAPMWSVGIALGITMGNLLPSRLVSALSVALFGMFLAVIIPPSRKDKVVGGCVVISFAASYAATMLPRISALSTGNRTILLTLIISAVAAALFPVKEAPGADEPADGTATKTTSDPAPGGAEKEVSHE